jgi:hypothetical protein
MMVCVYPHMDSDTGLSQTEWEKVLVRIELLNAGPAASLTDMDGAVMGHQFIGGHAGIPHNDQPGIRVQRVQIP